ncbi:MAG: DNA polymerase III subunit alpha [Thermodesulfovibrionaceae bacterium]
MHLHTEYSLLDGAIRINEVVRQAKQYGMPAVAITDHGNLFGVIEFYKQCKEYDINPIIGCELYVAPQSRFDKSKTKDLEEASYHLTVLVEDEKGYRNLNQLITLSYFEGFYYKPRVDLELLSQYNDGLIALSGCLKGEIPYWILQNNLEKAILAAKSFKEIFGERFFLEIQSNGIPEQAVVNQKLIEISNSLNIPLVATNDCHYLRKEDARAHEILLCIQTGKTIKDEKRFKFQTDEFYFKSPQEMYLTFKEIPQAIKNTLYIAERCEFNFSLGNYKLPKYDVPEGYSEDEFLERIAIEGLKERFNGEPPAEYIERLNKELEVIKRTGFSSYFLIVWDFINYARKRNIPIGPGRGSAAGSLVSYALKITDIDPIRYGLLFERFLNPERVSMPDIDVDFCKDRRAEVIEYVRQKYGYDKVANIITFGRLTARAVVRDVGRTLNIPYSEVDRLAKSIPLASSSLEEAINLDPKFRETIQRNETYKELIQIALRLEGLVRHSSQHAAGVVISPEPLLNFMPLYKNPGEDIVITQFDMKALEDIGLLKFDFLGLKTLTVIHETVKYAAEQGKKIDLNSIPLDDPDTYKLLSSGQTTGIFQLESRGMRDLLQRMQPERFEDLIALVALYRPGPLGSGMVEDFIKRKKGLIPIEYSLPELKEILDETYGVILYQEQVMRIANKIAGFTMGQADVLRKAMGKKIPELMVSLKDDFIKGATQKGISPSDAEALFNIMAAFGEYGFNKSHSAAYAYLAYVTAYLKAHYPLEFFAANLSNEMGDENKTVKFINECKSWSIEVKGPDINESERLFTITNNAIRFGLEAVKGVGEAAIESILKERKKKRFTSLHDFLIRVDTRKVNKKVVESLIKAGAFDSLYPSLSSNEARALAMEELNSFKEGAVGRGLFIAYDSVPAWDNATLLKEEKSSLGFYLISHPMKPLRAALNKKAVLPIADIFDIEEEVEEEDLKEVKIAGIIEEVKSKAKDKGVVGYITIEDETARVEVIIYPEVFQKYREILQEKNLILIKGVVIKSNDSLKFVAKEIESLNDLEFKVKYEIAVDCSDSKKAYQILKKVREFLTDKRDGEGSIYICLKFPEYDVIILSPFEPCIDFESKIQMIKECKVRVV